jgi:hypothetical protein
MNSPSIRRYAANRKRKKPITRFKARFFCQTDERVAALICSKKNRRIMYS